MTGRSQPLDSLIGCGGSVSLPSAGYGPGDGHTEQTGKTVRSGASVGQGTLKEERAFEYDLRGRLKTATVTQYEADGTTVASQSTSTFAYDDGGVRSEQS